MKRMGLSKEDLIAIFVGSVLFLILIFAFIFIGISAFSVNSSFNSVVSGAIPAISSGSSAKSYSFNYERIKNGMRNTVRKVLNTL